MGIQKVTQNNDQRGGRTILLLIAGLPVTMILAATWLWYFVEQGDIDIVGALGTANSGDLLAQPVNINTLPFTAAVGTPTSLESQESKWTFMVLNNGDACDETCSELLYLTRQIRIAIGRDFQRIQRLIVVDQPAATVAMQSGSLLLDAVAEEHPDLRVWQRGIEPVVPARHVSDNAWYLVDPSGWVMMRYSADVNYRDVIGDLKFLLKNSGG